MAKIIATHSFRGGTGKSNTTANLAALVARAGHRVAVIDTDIQSPGVHVIFALQPGDEGGIEHDRLTCAPQHGERLVLQGGERRVVHCRRRYPSGVAALVHSGVMPATAMTASTVEFASAARTLAREARRRGLVGPSDRMIGVDGLVQRLFDRLS